MKHTKETKQKISEGVRRHYDNMSVEENEQRKERIAIFRKRENRLYHYIKDHQDILRRVIDEVKKEQETKKDD
ncbi:MAG: hypothetical protein IKW83_08255 [Muribaculaceae bacterium]|nr:hypothetical protein [Bacteroidaceae bacterium]MBR5639741.1 hypothetical protein [Muribaculaceae bacterium]